MEQENQTPETEEMDILEREDRCRRSLKTVSRAMFMRLFVSGLLIWAVVQTGGEPWVLGLMGITLLINLSGLLPLSAEWKKRREELKKILEEDA